MNKRERRRFLRELIESVTKDLRAASDRAPDTWDGIELRWLAAERFEAATYRTAHYRKRWFDYAREVIERNL